MSLIPEFGGPSLLSTRVVIDMLMHAVVSIMSSCPVGMSGNMASSQSTALLRDYSTILFYHSYTFNPKDTMHQLAWQNELSACYHFYLLCHSFIFLMTERKIQGDTQQLSLQLAFAGPWEGEDRDAMEKFVWGIGFQTSKMSWNTRTVCYDWSETCLDTTILPGIPLPFGIAIFITLTLMPI